MIQNKMDSLAKNVMWMRKFIRLYKSLALTEANLMLENIMHEVQGKLSVLHLGGRKRVLYKAILKLVLQEICVSEFCTFLAKLVAFRKMSPDS